MKGRLDRIGIFSGWKVLMCGGEDIFGSVVW